MRIAKILAGVVLTPFLLVALIFAAARLHDGPIAMVAMIPGGALASGELVVAPVSDWTFATAIDTIELQLAGEATSRTTWILVNGGRAYIPCSLGFPPGKAWHLRADKDGRALVRIEGKRYPVSLKRRTGPDLEAELKAIVGSKYPDGPPSDAPAWFFALESRAS